MNTIIKPLNPLPITRKNGVIPNSIFLAGTIDMGTSEDWQRKVEEKLLTPHSDYCILNPRRDVWNPYWKQTIENDNFREQVEWELLALDVCEFIFMYFAPGSQSPITLLELGLYAQSKKIIVCCPEGYWRRGNVEIVCNRFDVPFYTDLDYAIEKCRYLRTTK